jgi:hypothetical protein
VLAVPYFTGLIRTVLEKFPPISNFTEIGVEFCFLLNFRFHVNFPPELTARLDVGADSHAPLPICTQGTILVPGAKPGATPLAVTSEPPPRKKLSFFRL